MRHRRSALARDTLAAAQVLEERVLLSTITVTSAADVAGAHSGVTLRDAINQANASAGADTIVFASSLNRSSIKLTQGQLQITDSLTIQGNGAKNTIVDAQQLSRVFDITDAAAAVTFDSLTITGGKTTAMNDGGGGIRTLSAGTLVIQNSAITGNSTTGAGATGGGVSSGLGAVTITSSTLSGNSTSGQSGSGGAVYAIGGSLSLVNSTITGNSTAGSTAFGGGIASPIGDISLVSTTLARNATTGSSASAGGIYTRVGNVTLSSSIVAQNTVVSGGYPDIFTNFPLGATATADHSIVGNRVGTRLTYAPLGSPDASGNLIGTTGFLIDPKLGALADNGGQTQTMALLAGSPALDAGGTTTLSYDQRGNPSARVLNGALDMGAFEGTAVSFVASVSVSAQTGTLTYGTAGTVTYTVTVNRVAGTTDAFDASLSLTGLPSGATAAFTVGGTAGNVLHFGANDTSLTATLTVTSATKSKAGSFTFTVSGERVASDGGSTGDLASKTGSLSIAKRVLVVSAAGQSKTYDGTTSATVTLSDNRVAGDVLNLSYSTAKFNSANVGTGKAIAVSGISVSGAAASNYTFNTTASTTGNVAVRAITVTADAQSKAQGAADPSLTYQLTAGTLVAGETLSGALTRAAGETPGSYAIGQGTLSAGSNYALTFVGNTLTIAPADSLVDSASVSAQSGTLSYGTAGTATYTVTVNRVAGTSGAFDVGLSIAGLPSGATAAFTVGGTAGNVLHFGATDTSLTATLTLTSAVKTQAGSLSFTVTAEHLDSNGNPTGDLASAAGSLSVNKRVLTVSAAGQGKTYDGTATAAVTLSDNRVAGDALSLAYSSAAFSSSSAGANKTITVSGIAVSGAAAGNYSFNATASAAATIAARAVTVTADSKSKVSGAADPLLTYQITSGALAGSDALSGALTRAAGETAGTYAISQGTLSAGGNYALTFVGNTFTIVPNETVGSASVSAQSGTLTYGTAGAATYTVTVNRIAGTTGPFDVGLSLAGLPSGVTSSFAVGGTVGSVLHFGANDTSLTATLTVTSALKTKAGTSGFTVTATRLDASGNATADVATGTGNFGIGKRVLVVSASGQSRSYDGSAAATVTLSDNRVAGDVLSVGAGSASFSNPDAGANKVISVSGITVSGAAASNYTFNTTASATASITARAITVAADAAGKVRGTEDPALTYQVTAGTLVAGDALSGALTRAPGEAPGTYAISQGTLSVDSNYTVTFVGSTFTIVPTDLSGPWVVDGSLVQIHQTGAALSFVDQNGTGSTGGFAGTNQITGRGGLTGAIDTGTADSGRIIWSDGTIWLRLSLGGQYYNPANGLLTSISQSGSSITMTTAFSGSSSGALTSATTFSIPGLGLVGTIQNGGIQFSNGAFWKKLNLSPTYTAVTGDIVTIQHDGTTNLVFTNRFGGTSNGNWISSTQVVATEFGITGTVANGVIAWSNGAIWTKSLTVVGKPLADGAVSIQAADGQLIATNKFGGSSRMQATGANTFNLPDFGLTATLSNGTLTFSNGAQWSNFDFNALDALFADIAAYPFG